MNQPIKWRNRVLFELRQADATYKELAETFGLSITRVMQIYFKCERQIKNPMPAWLNPCPGPHGDYWRKNYDRIDRS